MKLERLAILGVTLFLPATLGCSDPVPPPPEASLIFAFGPPALPGQGCNFGNSGTASIGGPPNIFTGSYEPRAVDGQDNTSVSCRVSGGGTFSISGRAVRTGTGATSFAVLNATAQEGGRGTAKIAVSAPATAGKQLISPDDTPCTLLLDVPNSSAQIAPGRVWAMFECGLVLNPSQPGSTCGLNGNFVFQNCEE